jgi:hypothetical protein
MGIGIVMIALPIIVLLMIGGGLAIGLVGMVFGKHDDRTSWQRFLRSFLSWWAWLSLFVWVLPWISFGALILTNEKAPATLPRITITNGEKTVIFQSMMHVASPEFYEEIKKDMESLAQKDYVFFYEWVKTGSEESLEKLSQLVGTDISEDMYNTVAKIAELAYQWDVLYTDILPSTNVDLSTDEIIALTDTSILETPPPTQLNIVQLIENQYPLLTPTQKYAAKILARGMMNMLLRRYSDPRIATTLKETIPIFTTILDKRDSLVAETITNSPNQRIYMHYGALHFAGILEWLQKNDPRWREVERRHFIVIR